MKGILLYTSYLEQIQLLNLEQRGLLLTAILLYSAGEHIPELDPATGMAFSFIKSNLDRNAEQYEEICAKRREAGKKGGRPRKQEPQKEEEAEKQKVSEKPNGFLKTYNKDKDRNKDKNRNNNRFLNFPQREYDYEQLEAALIRAQGDTR